MPKAFALDVLSNGLSPISSSTISLPRAFSALATPSTVNAVSTVSDRANSLSCTATSFSFASAIEADLGADQRFDVGRHVELGQRRAARRARCDPPFDDAHLVAGQRRLAFGRHERIVARRER